MVVAYLFYMDWKMTLFVVFFFFPVRDPRPLHPRPQDETGREPGQCESHHLAIQSLLWAN